MNRPPVAQIGQLLYRRLGVGFAVAPSRRCGLPIRDTADCQSALRFRGANRGFSQAVEFLPAGEGKREGENVRRLAACEYIGRFRPFSLTSILSRWERRSLGPLLVPSGHAGCRPCRARIFIRFTPTLIWSALNLTRKGFRRRGGPASKVSRAANERSRTRDRCSECGTPGVAAGNFSPLLLGIRDVAGRPHALADSMRQRVAQFRARLFGQGFQAVHRLRILRREIRGLADIAVQVV